MAQVIRREAQDGSASVVEAREDGSIVVEADTPEEAMAAARRRLGDDLQVREAVRAERGGVRGFFAREVFRVEAEPSAPPPAPTRPEVDALVRRIEAAADASSVAERSDDGIGRALDRVNDAEEEFGALLRRELGSRGLRSWSEDVAAQRDGTEPTVNDGRTGPAIDLRETAPTPRPGSPVPVGPAAGGRTAMPLLPPVPVPPTDVAAIGSLTPGVVAGTPALDPRPQPSARAEQTSPLAERVATPAVLRAPSGDIESTSSSVVASPPSSGDIESTSSVVASPPSSGDIEPSSSVVASPLSSGDIEPSSSVVVSPAAAVASSMVADADQAIAADAVAEVDPLAVAPAPGEVLWSVDRLAHLGLPFAVVEATVGLDPSDDFAWLQRLAERFADFVHVPTGRSVVFAGPRADRVAAGLGIPCVTPPELPPYGGSIGLKTIDDGAGRAWLGRVRGDRELHVVMSGRAWELLLTKEPSAVVAEGPDKVVAALQAAVEHGVRISHLLDGRHVRRANPLDLAIAVRALVGRR